MFKKLYWYIYARIKLWYLYRGNVPVWENERPSDINCPICYMGVGEDYDSENYLGSYDYYFGYFGDNSWTEKWKCERCGEVFEIDTGN